MLEYKYDTQLLIEGEGLDEDAIHDAIQPRFPGTACWRWGTRT